MRMGMMMGMSKKGRGRKSGATHRAKGTKVPHLPSRPRKSGLPDLRTIVCETRASPSFVAGRVDRMSAANAGGVGGLHLLRARVAPHP